MDKIKPYLMPFVLGLLAAWVFDKFIKPRLG
jgi:hypothetical protein